MNILQNYVHLDVCDMAEMPVPGYEVTFDSKAEAWYVIYLQELMEEGYIKNVYKAKSLHLRDKVVVQQQVDYKIRKPKVVDSVILGEVNYQPDFVVVWDSSAINKFCTINDIGIYNKLNKPKKYPKLVAQHSKSGELFSLVDVKPSTAYQGHKHTSTYTFFYKQHLMYIKYGLYVNKVKIKTLFKNSFTPKLYTYTDKRSLNRLRKLKYKPVDLKSYVNDLPRK